MRTPRSEAFSAFCNFFHAVIALVDSGEQIQLDCRLERAGLLVCIERLKNVLR